MTMSFNRLLRYLAALCLAALAGNASANCRIYHVSSLDAVSQVFKENNGYQFANYDSVCNKLNKANAQVVIYGQSNVLTNRSIGWALISIADKADNYLIVNDFGRYILNVSDYASDDKARELLWISINQAMNNWEGLDDAIAVLNKVRKARRTAKAK